MDKITAHNRYGNRLAKYLAWRCRNTEGFWTPLCYWAGTCGCCPQENSARIVGWVTPCRMVTEGDWTNLMIHPSLMARIKNGIAEGTLFAETRDWPTKRCGSRYIGK